MANYRVIRCLRRRQQTQSGSLYEGTGFLILCELATPGYGLVKMFNA